MVTKFGGQILAIKFGFVPDWLVKGIPDCLHIQYINKCNTGGVETGILQD